MVQLDERLPGGNVRAERNLCDKANCVIDGIADLQATCTQHIAGASERFGSKRGHETSRRCPEQLTVRRLGHDGVVFDDTGVASVRLNHRPERLERTTRAERILD